MHLHAFSVCFHAFSVHLRCGFWNHFLHLFQFIFLLLSCVYTYLHSFMCVHVCLPCGFSAYEVHFFEYF